MPRISWHDLPAATRAAAAEHTGTVHTTRTAGTGVNSGVAAMIDTERGPFFVKGVPTGHPQAGTQQREADINPHLPWGSPRLLWRVRTDKRDLLGFELLVARAADFTPGSADLPKIVAALKPARPDPLPRPPAQAGLTTVGALHRPCRAPLVPRRAPAAHRHGPAQRPRRRPRRAPDRLGLAHPRSRLDRHQKDVNTAHARRRGPGERVNAELKNWRVLRKIRSSPSTAATLIAAVQTLMIANA